ncbi:MAG: UPF0175 family protein [Hydrogenothermaceae bacterium]
MKVSIDLPDKVAEIMGDSQEMLEKNIKLNLALLLYKRGLLSFGRARELAGLSVWDFIEKLAEAKIPINYDVDDLEEDLRTIDKLFKEKIKNESNI